METEIDKQPLWILWLPLKNELLFNYFNVKQNNINFIYTFSKLQNQKKNTAVIVIHIRFLLVNNDNLGAKVTKIIAQDLANKNF